MTGRGTASGHGRAPEQVVRECLMAIRDGRVDDLLELVDPGVVCYPVFRPGRAAYHGREGMACLVGDMHSAHGDYEVDFGDVTVQYGAVVTVQATIVAGPGRDRPPLAVRTVFVFRGGRISRIESHPDGTAS
jgi:acetamidase/formamidase